MQDLESVRMTLLRINHIPLPRTSSVECFTVPLYLIQRYDGAGFETYPARTGWKVVEIPPVFYQNGSKVTVQADIAAFLQRWLYFGLLEEVTDYSTDPALFSTQTKSGDLNLTSLPLKDAISRWSHGAISRFCGGSEAHAQHLKSEQPVSTGAQQSTEIVQVRDDAVMDEIGDWMSKKLRTLSVAHNAWRLVVWDGPENKSMQELSCIDRVCLSIAALGEYLTRALHQIAEALGRDPGHTVSWQISATTIECLLLTLPGASQWCPNRIQGILKTGHCGVSLAWHLLNLEAPNTGYNHSECTALHCTSLNVRRGTYKTRRVLSACECAFEKVDSSSLENVVSQGEIALITYGSKVESCERRLKVKARLNGD